MASMVLPRGGPFAHALVKEVEALARAGRVGAVLFATTCDQVRRAAEDLEAPGLPVFTFCVPHTWATKGAAALYPAELRRFGRFLERIGGEAPSRERAAQVCLAFDRARRELLEARPFLGAPVALATRD